MSFFYPPLDEPTIRALGVVKTLIAENPTYFQESPYSAEVEQALAQWFRPQAVTASTGSAVLPEDPDEEEAPESMFEGLREEIRAAYVHLKSAKNDQHQDKLAYAKTSVGLLEKLVKMEAAVVNIEMVGNFQREILHIMETISTPEQRTKIMARLRNLVAPDLQEISTILNEEPQE